jgi:ubiquinone/menaquinone biosynthesis C-methylase UbiE
MLDHLALASGVSVGMSALDIGTGTGNLARRIAELGAEVTAIDPCAEMIEIARCKPGGARPITFSQVAEPFSALPYGDHAFHAVVASYAFHHVPHEEQGASLREMLRVLVPGGALAIGDIMFRDDAAAAAATAELRWLDDEPYPRLDRLHACAADLGLVLEDRQFGPCTWAVWGRRSAV